MAYTRQTPAGRPGPGRASHLVSPHLAAALGLLDTLDPQILDKAHERARAPRGLLSSGKISSATPLTPLGTCLPSTAQPLLTYARHPLRACPSTNSPWPVLRT